MAKKIFKSGRVCMVLSGKYAGRKVVVLKNLNTKTKSRNYYHALVIGMDKVPSKVNKNMSEKSIEKRIRVKPIIKYININHLFPTRYLYDKEFDFKSILKEYENIATISKNKEDEDKKVDPLANPESKKELKMKIKTMFEQTYKKLDLNSEEEETQNLRFFYKKLRF